MEDILTQRFHYATIIPYKDYSRLCDKNPILTTFNDSLDKLDGLEKLAWDEFQIVPSSIKGTIFSLPEKRGKKRTHYFHSENNEVQENFQLNYLYSGKDHSFDTIKDNQIKRHFGNPFSDVTIHTVERSIRRHGDKITIKIYEGYKRRKLNAIYFKKLFNVTSITFNLVTGNFTTLFISKGSKLPAKKEFRTNSFNSLKKILLKTSGLFEKKDINENYNFYDLYHESFNDVEFQNVAIDSLGLDHFSKDFFNKIMTKFVDTKKIKVSNNYEFWIENFYPTEKYLKKNERKIMASILDMFKIKSKITVKLIHDNSKLDIFGLSMLCYLFGEKFSKYVGSINLEFFKKSNVEKMRDYFPTRNMFIKDKSAHGYTLLDNEKENIVKIINNSVGLYIDFILLELLDHFNMIKKLRKYTPNLQMRAKTYDEFINEHSELSKQMSLIKKGWVTEYIFVDRMILEVEKPINVEIELPDGEQTLDIFYPYILKRDEEYDEEGSFMHHCVATYSDKKSSIIISIRTKDGSDRTTCEFDCQTGKLIQAKYFCNKQPPPEMELAIEELRDKTEYYARIGLLHSLEQKRVPVKINGVEIVVEDREPRRVNDLWGELGLRNPVPF
jgi:hypothetical protein